jgi:hypothetical protein
VNLTEQQEEMVEQKIASLGASGHLLHELTDHWCIQVEVEMKSGSPFAKALDLVIRSQSIAVPLCYFQKNSFYNRSYCIVCIFCRHRITSFKTGTATWRIAARLYINSLYFFAHLVFKKVVYTSR